MPESFGLSTEPMSGLFKTPQSELDGDLAASSAIMEAGGKRKSFSEALTVGSDARHRMSDPLLDLKRMQLQSQINENASQAANYIRELNLKNADVASEQRDRNVLTEAALRLKGKPEEYLEFLSQTNMESRWGLQTMNEQRLAIVSLMDHDQEAKNVASLSYKDRRAYKIALMQAGGQPDAVTDAIMDAGLARAIAAKAKKETTYAPSNLEKEEEYRQRLIDDGAPQSQIDRVTKRIEIGRQRAGFVDPETKKKSADFAATRKLETKIAGLEAKLIETGEEDAKKVKAELAAAKAELNDLMPNRGKPATMGAKRMADDASMANAPATRATSNVTQSEYENLKSGDLYWWNGKQIPKK